MALGPGAQEGPESLVLLLGVGLWPGPPPVWQGACAGVGGGSGAVSPNFPSAAPARATPLLTQ